MIAQVGILARIIYLPEKFVFASRTFSDASYHTSIVVELLVGIG